MSQRLEDKGNDRNPTIRDRRVTQSMIPIELQPNLKHCCATCKKEPTSEEKLKICSNCRLVSYCSRDCQAKDWARHKTEDECTQIKKIRQKMQKANRVIQQNRNQLVRQYILAYGGVEEAFFGRDIYNTDILDLLAGRFFNDPLTQQYMEAKLELGHKILHLEKHKQTVATWEAYLEEAVESRRLTHVRLPGFELGMLIAASLFKLHRDDDAFSYIQYWAEWRSRHILVDPLVLNSSKGEWIFPCEKNSRLLDPMDKIINNFQAEDGMWFPFGFLFVLLMIKVRHITIYRTRLLYADSFQGTTVSQTLPPDVCSAIRSYVVGSEEEESSLYEEQLEHANGLMECIDWLDQSSRPVILPALLNPSLLRSFQEEHPDLATADIRDFLDRYADGEPEVKTLRSMVLKRYGTVRDVLMQGLQLV